MPQSDMPKTNAERQADRDKRMKAAGLKQIRNLWGYPEDEAAVREFTATRTELRRIGKEAASRAPCRTNPEQESNAS